jgi:hypothetical protein
VEANPNVPGIEMAQIFEAAASLLLCIMKNQNSNLCARLKSDGGACKYMNIKASPQDELEKVLITWHEGMYSADLPTDGAIRREKAARVAKKFGQNYFEASSG